jgi:hypothetical protein
MLNLLLVRLINLVNKQKSKLKGESKVIGSRINKEINNLVKAKRIGLKLESLLENYTEKLKEVQIKKAKTADKSKIKKQLKEKLARDFQGLRTFKNQFDLLSKVDQKDLQKITKQIKNKLGK